MGSHVSHRCWGKPGTDRFTFTPPACSARKHPESSHWTMPSCSTIAPNHDGHVRHATCLPRATYLDGLEGKRQLVLSTATLLHRRGKYLYIALTLSEATPSISLIHVLRNVRQGTPRMRSITVFDRLFVFLEKLPPHSNCRDAVRTS
jgi:hypothetical protein